MDTLDRFAAVVERVEDYASLVEQVAKDTGQDVVVVTPERTYASVHELNRTMRGQLALWREQIRHDRENLRIWIEQPADADAQLHAELERSRVAKAALQRAAERDS